MLAFGLRMLWHGSLGPILTVLLVGATGLALLKDSFSEKPTNQMAYGAATLLFGYGVWNGVGEAWSSFHGIGLSSLSHTASNLFGAWCALLCVMVLLAMFDKKADFSHSTSLPIMSTSWSLGIVATLSGLHSLFSMRLDGIVGTTATLCFTLLILGLGVMLVRGKMAHLACFGLGLVMATSTLWTLLTNDLLRSLASLTSLPFYGVLLASAFLALLGTFCLGAEVAKAKTLPVK